jgi:RNA polymerase sigma-70 factor, ECF subfamily
LLNENPESLFKSWLTEHGGAVLKVARAYTLTAEDCQDLVQEILLQVWQSLPQFQGRASPSTWSYRVALNTALGWRRKERRRRVRQQPILEAEDLPVVGLDGAQQAAQREVVERLYAAIRRLPRTDAALVLLFLDGLSYRQMAEVLGISESNVGVKLNRAKKALGEAMNEEPHGPRRPQTSLADATVESPTDDRR